MSLAVCWVAGLTGADLTYLAINWADVADNRQELFMMLCLVGINLLLGICTSPATHALCDCGAHFASVGCGGC
jgi:hypothetical protein